MFGNLNALHTSSAESHRECEEGSVSFSNVRDAFKKLFNKSLHIMEGFRFDNDVIINVSLLILHTSFVELLRNENIMDFNLFDRLWPNWLVVI